MTTFRSKVATGAITAKGSKLNAWHAMGDLLAKLEDDAPKEAIICELAQLYAHHLPSKPRKPKQQWDWLVSALTSDKKELRDFLRYVNVIDGTAYASDGQIMNTMPTELADGCYDRAGTKVNQTPHHPMARIIPDNPSPTELHVVREFVPDNVTKPKTLVELNAENLSVCVDSTYWHKAVSMGYPETIHGRTERNQVRLDWTDGRTSVVMPYYMKW